MGLFTSSFFLLYKTGVEKSSKRNRTLASYSMICQNMAKDKYKIPEVDSLKEIGFQFEYAKLNEAIKYIRSFVAANIESLILLYYPDQCILDDDGNTIDLIRWADPNIFDDVLYDEKTEKEIIDKIIRIEKGNIKTEDYALVAVSYTHLRAHETVLDLVCR